MAAAEGLPWLLWDHLSAAVTLLAADETGWTLPNLFRRATLVTQSFGNALAMFGALCGFAVFCRSAFLAYQNVQGAHHGSMVGPTVGMAIGLVMVVFLVVVGGVGGWIYG